MKCDECANFKPKRKQTGWECDSQRGFRHIILTDDLGDWPGWRPFYGKVVE